MGSSAGRVLLIPKGDWNAETTYTGLDWVRHNGAAWVCKNTCTNVEPTEENSDNWQIIARDGQSGSVINADANMSDTSENPVQNKVIKKYVDEHTPEIDDMTGATSTENGVHGLVPAPQAGDEKKALLGNGTWGSVIDVDAVMSDTSVNPVQNKVIKKYVDDKQVNIDGITLTLDETRNVIKLADTLKDKIGSALQPESIVNNQTTTVEGFALDARQANPNLDGTLAKQVADLNGSLTLEEFTKRIYNDKTLFLTGVISGDAAVAVFYYPNSIKPKSVNILNQINIFNTGIADLQSYSINNEVLIVNLQQASVPGRACGVYAKLTY